MPSGREATRQSSKDMRKVVPLDPILLSAHDFLDQCTGAGYYDASAIVLVYPPDKNGERKYKLCINALEDTDHETALVPGIRALVKTLAHATQPVSGLDE